MKKTQIWEEEAQESPLGLQGGVRAEGSRLRGRVTPPLLTPPPPLTCDLGLASGGPSVQTRWRAPETLAPEKPGLFSHLLLGDLRCF